MLYRRPGLPGPGDPLTRYRLAAHALNRVFCADAERLHISRRPAARHGRRRHTAVVFETLCRPHPSRPNGVHVRSRGHESRHHPGERGLGHFTPLSRRARLGPVRPDALLRHAATMDSSLARRRRRCGRRPLSVAPSSASSSRAIELVDGAQKTHALIRPGAAGPRYLRIEFESARRSASAARGAAAGRIDMNERTLGCAARSVVEQAGVARRSLHIWSMSVRLTASAGLGASFGWDAGSSRHVAAAARLCRSWSGLVRSAQSVCRPQTPIHDLSHTHSCPASGHRPTATTR